MMLQVNQALCAGCGVCVDNCPVGAIHLENQRAVISEDLCTHCEACVNACPNGAITAQPAQMHNLPTRKVPVTESQIIPISINTELSEPAASTKSKTPGTNAILTLLKSELAPRLVDLLTNTLERKLARPAARSLISPSSPAQSVSRAAKGTHRQI